MASSSAATPPPQPPSWVHFTNARVLFDRTISPLGALEVLCEDGAVVAVDAPFAVSALRPPSTALSVVDVDCGGLILAPGFIDIQFNGGWGTAFTDAALTPEGVACVAERLAAEAGVTSFVATVVTCTPDTASASALAIAEAKAQAQSRRPRHKPQSELLGVHMEGPCLCPSKKGAHDELLLRAPSALLAPAPANASPPNAPLPITPPSLFGSFDLAAFDGVRMITLAPDLPGAREAIASLAARGVVVSLGHSPATMAQGIDALDAGATCLTHLFNAMAPLHHREPGLAGLIALEPPSRRVPFFGLIADDAHVCAVSCNLASKCHPEGVVLTSDSSPLIGMPDGATARFVGMYNPPEVEMKQGRVVMAGTDTLAGGCALLDACVRNYRRFTGCGVVQAVEAATRNPARLLGVFPRKGAICEGADADLVLLDDDLMLCRTFVRGECASWQRGEGKEEGGEGKDGKDGKEEGEGRGQKEGEGDSVRRPLRVTLRRAKFNFKYRRQKKQKPRLKADDIAAYEHLLQGTRTPVRFGYDPETNDLWFDTHTHTPSTGDDGGDIDFDGFDTGGQVIRWWLQWVIRQAGGRVVAPTTMMIPSDGKACMLYIQAVMYTLAVGESFTVCGGNPANSDAPSHAFLCTLYDELRALLGISFILEDETHGGKPQFTLRRLADVEPDAEWRSADNSLHMTDQLLMAISFAKPLQQIVLRCESNSRDYHIPAMIRLMVQDGMTVVVVDDKTSGRILTIG